MLDHGVKENVEMADGKSLDWKDVYESWESGMYYFNKDSDVINIETVHVDYSYEGNYFWGYDWLSNTETIERKKLIQDRTTEFLLFTQPTNKGTIHTIEMLSEAKTAEERAAIWIAATAFELMDPGYERNISKQARILYRSATQFLRDHFYIWHHAMRKLVPEIMISPWLLERVENCDINTMIGIIQTNMVMLQGNYKVLLYSSLLDETIPKGHSVRRNINGEMLM